MKRMICILCLLCLVISLVPCVHADGISQKTVDIMAAIGGETLDEFTTRWEAIERNYSVIERNLHTRAYRDSYYGATSAPPKYVDFLVSAGMCQPGSSLTNKNAYDLVREFRNNTAHIKDDYSAYYQALTDYRSSNHMGAASLFSENGSSLHMGSLLIGALGGLLIGMGLMAFIAKKKSANG